MSQDDTKRYKGVGQYPLYHTGYETFYLVDDITDPGYRIHKTCAQTSMHMLLNLADSLILPYNLNHLSEAMVDSIEKFKKSGVESLLEDNGATLKYLEEAVKEFVTSCSDFMESLKDMEKNNPIKLRMVNDQMMQLDRVFIIPGGLPDR